MYVGLCELVSLFMQLLADNKFSILISFHRLLSYSSHKAVHYIKKNSHNNRQNNSLGGVRLRILIGIAWIDTVRTNSANESQSKQAVAAFLNSAHTGRVAHSSGLNGRVIVIDRGTNVLGHSPTYRKSMWRHRGAYPARACTPDIHVE